MVNSGIVLISVIDPLSGEVIRQPYYRSIGAAPASNQHLKDELKPKGTPP